MDRTHQLLNNMVVYIGVFIHYGMQLFENDPKVLLVYVNIGVGILVIVFTSIQIFYKIKNNSDD